MLESIAVFLLASGISLSDVQHVNDGINGAKVFRTQDKIIIVKPDQAMGEAIVLIDVIAVGRVE